MKYRNVLSSCGKGCKEKSCKTAAGDHEESETAAVKGREEAHEISCAT